MCGLTIAFLFPSRADLLREWRTDNGLKATYKALLEACVKTTNGDAADRIVEYLNGKYYSFSLTLLTSALKFGQGLPPKLSIEKYPLFVLISCGNIAPIFQINSAFNTRVGYPSSYIKFGIINSH